MRLLFLTAALVLSTGLAHAQTGACCLGGGQCQVMDEATCLDNGGTYGGDGTTCSPNPCDQPITGACCFYTFGCLSLTEADCLAEGGEYQGDDTVCWPNPCAGGDPPQTGWTENFDSYANSTLLYNIGGWSGWDDSAAACGTVTNDEYRSEPHSIVVNDTSDAVHPFTGFEGGVWTITAYQYIPSGLSGMSYFVVNSYYEHGGPYFWAVEMHFDPSNGKVSDSVRDPNGTMATDIIYDQWVEIRIEADLTGGLGTIEEYYNDVLVGSGDWITGSVGQLAIGNIDLYAPHSTPVYYDDLSLQPNEGTTPTNPTRPLFAGVLYGDLNTRSTDLSDYPDVTWNNGFIFGVDGAAGRPDGSLYLTTGSFNSELYAAPVEGPAVYLCDLEYGTSGLACGKNGRLFGFCNSASPMGIYEIFPATGEMQLLVETGSMRFFGLDYNPADGLLYGYTEYGTTGLYSIDIDTGTMTFIAARPDVSNAAGRGLACGGNKVYVVTVYGETVPMQVYDLAQGLNGSWEEMTHPFPDSNSTSGAAWTHPVEGDLDLDGDVDLADLQMLLAGYGTTADAVWSDGDLDGDGDVDLADLQLLLAHYGYGQ